MKPKIVPALVAAILAVGVVVVSACGDDEEAGAPRGAETTATRGNSSEAAFLRGMAHHHGSAIEMAEVAQNRTNVPEIKQLANAIITTQNAELTTMQEIHRDLFSSDLKPDAGAHDGLGLSAVEAGMTHGPADNKKLETADPFDREFVDMMAPHHAGAVRMAEVVLTKTKNTKIRALAENIIKTQKAEIETMDTFRKREYGAGVKTAPESGMGDKAPKHGAGHGG